jgi:hypothetical protein
MTDRNCELCAYCVEKGNELYCNYYDNYCDDDESNCEHFIRKCVKG